MARLKRSAAKYAKMAQAVALNLDGLPNSEIAKRIGVSRQMVDRYLRESVETNRRAPVTLSIEDIMAKRAEVEAWIDAAYAEVKARVIAMKQRPPRTHEQEVSQLVAVTRAADSIVKLADRKAALYGLDAPKRVVEAMFHIPINRDGLKVVFDTSQMIKHIESDNSDIVPGLQMFSGDSPEGGPDSFTDIYPPGV